MRNERSFAVLMDRISRLHAARTRRGDLNATQAATLAYLSSANRFSRSPSHVAEFLAATKGTVSQTLKSLAQKGLIEEHPSSHDKRSIRYDLTKKGQGLQQEADEIFNTREVRTAAETLEAAYRKSLDGRSFGLCASCRWHIVEGPNRQCGLMKVRLSDGDAAQICFEHATPKV